MLDNALTGPGCSSIGYGAMMELGPFRVNNDNKTLSTNKHAWNNGGDMLTATELPTFYSIDTIYTYLVSDL